MKNKILVIVFIVYISLFSFNPKNVNLIDVNAIIDLAFKELR